MSNPPTLGKLAHRRSETAISLQGELDLYTVNELRRLLYDPGCRSRVLVDLSDTTFIDSTTLTELFWFHLWLDRRGGSLTILCPSREIRSIFELTGLDRALTLEPRAPADLNGGRTVSVGPDAA
jgi:anti-sigma B factor antagonist